jgi:hypothetical protein
MLALAGMARFQYRRVRRLQPAAYGLDPLPVEGPIQFAPAAKRPDRVASALRAWSAERAQADLVTPPPAPEREAQSKLQSHAAPPATEPAAPVSEPETAPKFDAPPSEPSAASEQRFIPPRDTLPSPNADHYETLQVSPNADPETIHRVYRIMASRFHPDNPVTGSVERFLQLREAYQTLSDPALRMAYDANHRILQTEPLPVFWQKSFVDGIEGETNRRLGVLSLLYHRRRVNDNKPGVSVLELEQRMAFPREYLNFALWYLHSKGYVTLLEDNSDYAITSAGIDFVESCSAKNKVIRELLTAGSPAEAAQSPERAKNVRRMLPRLPREPRAETGFRASAGSSGGD